jgi:hypothetical protein
LSGKGKKGIKEILELILSLFMIIEISLIRMIKIFAANLIHWGFLDAF